MCDQFEEQYNLSQTKWISIDFHIHSIYSGGSLTPSGILNSSKLHLLDAVAISDHNEIKGASEAQEITVTNSGYPLVISSQEISAGDHFHFLLIGSKERQPDLNRHNLINAIRTHRENGGAVILAHPWTVPKNRWVKELLEVLLTEKMIDGIELFNSSILEISDNRASIINGLWDEIVIPYNVAVVGGSDFHYLKKSRIIGGGRTFLKVTELSETGVIKALRAGRTVAGLFAQQVVDFGSIGKGTNLFLGNEPWHSELENITTELINTVNHCFNYHPITRKQLLKLIGIGCFQLVYELLVVSNCQTNISD